jgi:hypothetical protein
MNSFFSISFRQKIKINKTAKYKKAAHNDFVEIDIWSHFCQFTINIMQIFNEEPSIF